MTEPYVRMEESDRLEIKNLILQISLEESKKENLNLQLMLTEARIQEIKNNVDEWQKKYIQKLNIYHPMFDTNGIAINPETGWVTRREGPNATNS